VALWLAEKDLESAEKAPEVPSDVVSLRPSAVTSNGGFAEAIRGGGQKSGGTAGSTGSLVRGALGG